MKLKKFYDPLTVNLLAKCKRANPALANWCFFRAPFTHESAYPNYWPLFLEQIEFDNNGSFIAVAKRQRNHSSSEKTYHIGLECRTNEKGDKAGETGEAIEKAASQISRGLNGFIGTLRDNIQLLGEDKDVRFLPVIFTTASLWASIIDLSTADLNTGKLDLSQTPPTKIPWLCYQYTLSPGIKHFASPTEKPSKIGELMMSEYVRSIIIVSPDGIEDFLEWSSYGGAYG